MRRIPPKYIIKAYVTPCWEFVFGGHVCGVFLNTWVGRGKRNTLP